MRLPISRQNGIRSSSVDHRVVGDDPALHADGHERRDDRPDAALGELRLPVEADRVARAVVVVEAPGDVRAEQPVLDSQVSEVKRLEDGIARRGIRFGLGFASGRVPRSTSFVDVNGVLRSPREHRPALGCRPDGERMGRSARPEPRPVPGASQRMTTRCVIGYVQARSRARGIPASQIRGGRAGVQAHGPSEDRRRRAVKVRIAIVVAWFVVLGVVGAFVMTRSDPEKHAEHRRALQVRLDRRRGPVGGSRVALARAARGLRRPAAQGPRQGL